METRTRLIAAAAMLFAGQVMAATNAPGALRVGAAKADVTPKQSELSFPETDIINNHVYVRAVVINNGADCAVIIGTDMNSMRGSQVADVIARTSQTTGCPAANYLVTGTRSHSSTSGISSAEGVPTDAQVTDAMVQAVVQAAGRLEPARVGFGTTSLDLNVNRDLYEDNRWYQGNNYAGPSDKTLSVLAFIGEDNLPIAVYMNYSMHVINWYLTGVYGPDYPGAASRWVERRFGERTVAIYTQSATGDQNQRFHDLSYMLSAYRTHNKEAQQDHIIGPDVWKTESMATNANLVSRAGMDKPLQPEEMDAYRHAYELTDELVSAIGVMIGESAIEVMKYKIADYESEAGIFAASTSMSCPGQARVVEPGATPARENVRPVYKDAGPRNIKVGLLQIGDIDIFSVNGDLYNGIASRIKAESPAARTMVVSIANTEGPQNTIYMPTDEAYSHLTFQMIGMQFKPGCVEDSIAAASKQLAQAAAAGK